MSIASGHELACNLVIGCEEEMMREKLTCVSCGKGSHYRIMKKARTCPDCGVKHPSVVDSTDRHRVRKGLCVRCYKKEMLAQMRDEIGGFLGNREWHGENNLVAMCQDPQLKRWGKSYGASEYQMFRALKAMQDGEILNIEDGPVEALERRLR